MIIENHPQALTNSRVLQTFDLALVTSYTVERKLQQKFHGTNTCIKCSSPLSLQGLYKNSFRCTVLTCIKSSHIIFKPDKLFLFWRERRRKYESKLKCNGEAKEKKQKVSGDLKLFWQSSTQGCR